MSDITEWPSYDSIAHLDPLNFDDVAIELPRYNQDKNIHSLSSCYSLMLKDAAVIFEEGIDTANAVAAIRDLDFVASSLVRHNANEIAEQETAQEIFIRLGKVAGTVPRGTVFTYAAVNPKRERQRTFTNDEQECVFIDEVRDSVNMLDKCLWSISNAAQGDIEGLVNASVLLNHMVDAITNVMHKVSPDFFTFQMRPYFDSLNIGGATFAGAGGAQMQVIAIDRIIWGVDCKDPEYLDYYADNIRYLTPNQRQTIADFQASTQNKSLVSLLQEGNWSQDAILSVHSLLIALRRFRYPHRKIAKNNFKLRSQDAVGSGRYAPGILDKLIELNKVALLDVEEVMK